MGRGFVNQGSGCLGSGSEVQGSKVEGLGTRVLRFRI